MAKRQVGAIDADLMRRVDEARGDVSRVRWVERALEKALGSGSLTATGDRGTRDSGSSQSVPASSRAPVLAEVQAEVSELRERRLAHANETLAAAARSCERCGVPIPSPSLTRHPGCGGKVLPEPAA